MVLFDVHFIGYVDNTDGKIVLGISAEFPTITFVFCNFIEPTIIFTLIVLDTPFEYVTNIFVSPTATPFTTPNPSTVAIDLFSDINVKPVFPATFVAIF